MPFKGNGKNKKQKKTTFLCFNRRALTLKKSLTPTVETQVQLCAANVGVEGKQHFVWDICIKFDWLPSG